MASACDHIDHVRTQLPYAIVVALVSVAVGDIPTALGAPPWIVLPAGIAVMFVVLRIFGRPTEEIRPTPYRAERSVVGAAR
jgi:Na+/H+ antiporter NhaC